MNKNTLLNLLKLFVILVLTNAITFSQNGETTKSGCGGKTTKTVTGVSDLESRRWQFTEINDAKVENAAPFVEFNLKEKRFAGNAGCNRMFGSVEIMGNDVKFSKIGTTKIFCSKEGVMKLEGDFVKALEQTTRFERQGETLNLYAGNNLILKFSGMAKNASGENTSGENDSDETRLEDKRWTLAAIAEKPLPKLEKTPFLVFDKQKQSAGGDTGCNSFGGSYKTQANKISVTEIISTMRACIEAERMNIEREFLGGLQKTNRFEVKAGKLNLYEGDKLLLTFNAQVKN